MPWPRMDDWQGSWLGKALDCNGDGCLATMEHKAGIERVTGHRLESGHEFGFGY